MARGWGDTSLDDMCTQPGEATENKLAAYEDVTAELGDSRCRTDGTIASMCNKFQQGRCDDFPDLATTFARYCGDLPG